MRLCDDEAPEKVTDPPDDGGSCTGRSESGVAAVLEYGPGGQVTDVGAFGGVDTTFFRACGWQASRATRSFWDGSDCPPDEPRSACYDTGGGRSIHGVAHLRGVVSRSKVASQGIRKTATS